MAGAKKSESSSLIERASFGAFLAALAVIAFTIGAIAATAEFFPGTLVAQAYKGGQALYNRYTAYEDLFTTDLWYPTRRAETGVTLLDGERAAAGHTLYTSGERAIARLIDMQGDVLHSWRKPYSEVWTKEAAVRDPQPDSHVFFRKAHLYPNGDLLAIYEGVGDTPYGYGMVKLDRESNVLWSFLEHAHHSFDVAGNGDIYVLVHEISNERIKGFDMLAAPRLEDSLVILSPEGKELRRINLTKAVAGSSYSRLLHLIPHYALADPLHSNDVDVIDEEEAASLGFAEAGQVMLSFRELGAIAVLDPASETLVWATRGAWIGQHDPDITAGGHILLFDNQGRYQRPGGGSRILEIDPRTMEIVWTFEGDALAPFDSDIRASQQRLPNGNTLITESTGGRILEVAPEGDVVWEFLNPVREEGKDGSYIPIICFAERLDASATAMALGEPPTLTTDATMEIEK